MIHQLILELRSQDRAHILVQNALHHHQTNTPTQFQQAVVKGLHQLLEKADTIESKTKIKFLARTLYMCLTINGEDMLDSDNIINLLYKSSLLQAYEAQENPQNLHQLLGNDVNSQFNLYLSSVDHELVKNKLMQLIGQISNVSSPYDYAELIGKQLTLNNFEKLSSYIIDICLTIPETFYFSSEDIFIGACLYIIYKFNCVTLQNYLNTHFAGEYMKSYQLLGWLQQMFLGAQPSN